jgi:hypothetical protein
MQAATACTLAVASAIAPVNERSTGQITGSFVRRESGFVFSAIRA